MKSWRLYFFKVFSKEESLQCRMVAFLILIINCLLYYQKKPKNQEIQCLEVLRCTASLFNCRYVSFASNNYKTSVGSSSSKTDRWRLRAGGRLTFKAWFATFNFNWIYVRSLWKSRRAISPAQKNVYAYD